MPKIKDDNFTKIFIENLLASGEVKVQGLGFFNIKKCKGGGKRIFKGQEVVTPDYNKITFRPSGPLKRKIKAYGGQ